MATQKMNAELAASSLSAEQKERLHEVADLLLQIYQTLIEMRHIHPEALRKGPHTFSEEILTIYEECKIAPSIIYLYSIMPYIERRIIDSQRFFDGSYFFDPFDEDNVRQRRDPRSLRPEGGFDHENGEYMYPWYTPLSSGSNVMIYDAERHLVWIVNHSRNTLDPVYCKTGYGKPGKSIESIKVEDDYGGSDNTDDQNQEGGLRSEEDISGGSRKFWSDENGPVGMPEVEALETGLAEVMNNDEGFVQVEKFNEQDRYQAALDVPTNKNSLEAVRNRPAGDVLRDIDRWHRELRVLPGRPTDDRWEDFKFKSLESMYENNGWPDAFDGDAFEVDYARAIAVPCAHGTARLPLAEVRCYSYALETNKFDEEIEKFQSRIAKTRNREHEWKYRIRLHDLEQRISEQYWSLGWAKQRAERDCPGGVAQRDEDLPLWELAELERQIQRHRYELKSPKWFGCVSELDSDDLIRYRLTQRKLAIYEKAYRASKSDADRLRPGMTLEKATGWKHISLSFPRPLSDKRDCFERRKDTLKAMRDFASTIPKDLPKAVFRMGARIKAAERELQDLAKEIENYDRKVAEFWMEHPPVEGTV